MVNASSLNKPDHHDAASIWKECLKSIKENVTLMTYNTWFLPIKPLELNGFTLKVQIPSQFFWEWIDEHYNTLINRTILDVIGPEAKLSYIIAEDKERKDNQERELPVIQLARDVPVQQPKHETLFKSPLHI